MSKTAVIYWSGTGNTEAMAMAVAEGMKDAGSSGEVFSVDAISPDQLSAYDCIALGCPAMGAEVLEEDEFQPFYDAARSALNGKKVGLFGSYGWGDGEWMRDWEDDAKSAGADLVMEGVMANEAPDDDALENCRALGKALS